MPRVLVVDDNPLSLRFFEDALAALGIECTTASGGGEAIRIAAGSRFDLLLIDARMPDMDGARVLSEIRGGGGASRDTPAWASTAASPSAHPALGAAGFDAVLQKPISLRELRVALAAYLPRRDLHGSNSASACLDDPRALAVAGDDETIVRALRGLLLLELDGVPGEFRDMSERHDVRGMAERLHRLAASAGLCGAVALERAVAALGDALDGDPRTRDAALTRLLAACVETQQSISATGASSASTP